MPTTGPIEPGHRAETKPRAYPLPQPAEDPRFTFGLTLEVSRVLAAHGYPAVDTGDDFVALEQALFGFLYARNPAAEQAPARATCRHDRAYVEAYIGHPGGDDPDESGLPWEVLDPERRDLDGQRSYMALGACECGRRVVSVRSWAPKSERGATAWSSRWTPLVLDGDDAEEASR